MHADSNLDGSGRRSSRLGVGYAAGDKEGMLIGGLAGTAAGLLAGELICVQQRRLEAQKAASKARVEQAQTVLKKYRDYDGTAKREHLCHY